jgi:hypothetical protein
MNPITSIYGQGYLLLVSLFLIVIISFIIMGGYLLSSYLLIFITATIIVQY